MIILYINVRSISLVADGKFDTFEYFFVTLFILNGLAVAVEIIAVEEFVTRSNTYHNGHFAYGNSDYGRISGLIIIQVMTFGVRSLITHEMNPCEISTCIFGSNRIGKFRVGTVLIFDAVSVQFRPGINTRIRTELELLSFVETLDKIFEVKGFSVVNLLVICNGSSYTDLFSCDIHNRGQRHILIQVGSAENVFEFVRTRVGDAVLIEVGIGFERNVLPNDLTVFVNNGSLLIGDGQIHVDDKFRVKGAGSRQAFNLKRHGPYAAVVVQIPYCDIGLSPLSFGNIQRACLNDELAVYAVIIARNHQVIVGKRISFFGRQVYPEVVSACIQSGRPAGYYASYRRYK